MIVDELVYLISEHGGDENVEAYLAHLLRTWNMMKKFWKEPAEVEKAARTLTLPKEQDVEEAPADEVKVLKDDKDREDYRRKQEEEAAIAKEIKKRLEAATKPPLPTTQPSPPVEPLPPAPTIDSESGSGKEGGDASSESDAEHL